MNIGGLKGGIMGIINSAKKGNVESIVDSSLNVAKMLFGGAKG